MRLWTGCAICPSRIWDLQKWIIIALCATECPRSFWDRGRDPDQVAGIASALLAKSQNLLVDAGN